MTVSYSDSVATAQPWTFLKLLLRWKGSVYKLLWKDLLFFIILFYFIHFIYINLPEDGQQNFQTFVTYMRTYGNAIPLSFVLGFYVNAVMNRWWNQFEAIPYPASIAVYITSTLHGYDEVGRAMRRTIMRYVCLSLTLVFRKISTRVQKRFPKFKDLIISGLMNDSEVTIIEDLEAKYPGYSKNWLPIVWAISIVSRARREGRIHDDMTVNTIIQALNDFRSKCTVLLYYNTITIPLVYTQVVCIAVYTYFLTALFSQQYLKTKQPLYIGPFNLDTHPILLILQFIFYMGWMKVAEALLNPFGQDDDDFDVNSMIDRNLQTSYIIVDHTHNDHPEILKDRYWNELPNSLPDRAKTIFTQDSPRRMNDADIVDYIEPRISDFRKELEQKINASYMVVQVKEPSNLLPDSGIISSVYKHLENVEQEQNIINQTIERKIHSNESYSLRESMDHSDKYHKINKS